MNFAIKNSSIYFDDYKDSFKKYKNELCFKFDCIYNVLRYAPKEFYINDKNYDNYKIITWNKFINNEVDNMEKTFKEVIRDIKKGEIWESEYKKIYFNSFEQIQIESKDNDQNIMAFNDSVMYTLKRKKYDFEDAFEAYKDGKEIESCDTQTRYIYDDADLYFDKNENDWLEINYWLIDEINEKWYIND